MLFLSIYDPYALGSGPATHLRYLSQELNKLGCEVHTLVLNSINKSQIVNGIHLHYPSSRFFIPVGKAIIFPIFSFKDVNKLVEKFKIDIIHGQSPSSFGYALSKRDRTPFVVTLHSTSFGEIESYFNVALSCINFRLIYDTMFTQPLWAFLTAMEYKCADKVIAVSKAVAQEAAKFFHLPKEKMAIIHNGVNLPTFSNVAVEKQNEDYTILFVGRLIWRKGVRFLLEAMSHVLAEYPTAQLWIVGDGEQRVSLEKCARKLGIENSVHFFGSVSTEKLYSLYSQAGVYAQPSFYEPCAIATLEAMSMGKPIVSTSVGGIPELIKNGENGLLVEPGNSLQLANAIMNVFSNSSYGRKLGSNARERVLKEFTWKTIAQQTLLLYEDVLQNR